MLSSVMLDYENPLFLSPELKKFILEKFKPESIDSIDWCGKDGFRLYTAVAKDGFKILFTVHAPEIKVFEDCLIPDSYTLNGLYSPETGKEYTIEKEISFWNFRLRHLLKSLKKRYYKDITDHCDRRRKDFEEAGKKNLGEF